MSSPDSSSSGPQSFGLLRDAGLAGGLLLALGVVFLVDHFQRPPPSPVEPKVEVMNPIPEEPVRMSAHWRSPRFGPNTTTWAIFSPRWAETTRSSTRFPWTTC